MKSLIPLLALISLSQCGPVVQENDSVLKTVIGNFVNCMNGDLNLCLKEKALKVTERLASVRELKIFDGLTILNSGAEKQGRSVEPLSDDLETRKKQITERLQETTTAILENSELEINVPGITDDDNDEKSTEEGRGKKKEVKKKLKVLVPLLILGKIKAVLLITAFLGIIALSLFKLMIMAKIAFLAKALAILKWLISKHHHHEEHGWIPHEEHHEPHGWEGGWSRSRGDAQNLAYSAHKK